MAVPWNVSEYFKKMILVFSAAWVMGLLLEEGRKVKLGREYSMPGSTE